MAGLAMSSDMWIGCRVGCGHFFLFALWCSRPRGRTLGCLHSGGRERHRRRLWLPARLRLRHGPSAPSRCCDWLWPIVEIRRRTSWVSAAASGPAQDAGAFLLRFFHSQIRCNQAYPHRHQVYFAIPGGRLDFLRARPSTSPSLPPGPVSTAPSPLPGRFSSRIYHHSFGCSPA